MSENKKEVKLVLGTKEVQQLESLSKAFGKPLERFIIENLRMDLHFALEHLSDEELETYYDKKIVDQEELINIKK